jgi:hypothetical protein
MHQLSLAARPSRPCVAARHYLTRLSAAHPAGLAGRPCWQKRRPAEAKVYDLKSSIYGPGLSLIDHQPCRLFEADKLLFIIISFSSSLITEKMFKFILYIKLHQPAEPFDSTVKGSKKK